MHQGRRDLQEQLLACLDELRGRYGNRFLLSSHVRLSKWSITSCVVHLHNEVRDTLQTWSTFLTSYWSTLCLHIFMILSCDRCRCWKVDCTVSPRLPVLYNTKRAWLWRCIKPPIFKLVLYTVLTKLLCHGSVSMALLLQLAPDKPYTIKIWKCPCSGFCEGKHSGRRD